MKVKLKDIAQKAGVSPTTCSLILNNKPINVSEETKQNVLTIAQEMGYTVRQKIHNLGLVVPDLGNLYYTEIIKNVSHAAQKFGYNLVILDSNNSTEQEDRNLQQLRQTQVDGILLALVPDRADQFPLISLVREINRDKIPVVLLNYNVTALGCHSVTVDDYYGGYVATMHLLSQGHKKIGCICGSRLSPTDMPNRLTGYEAALTESGLRREEDLIIWGEYTVECGYKSAPLLLEKGVTAIFAHNDMIALGVYHYLKEHQIRVPEDISLVGFDDIPIISSMELPLTTVAQPIETIAERSIDILLESIQSPSADRLSVTLLPELIVRATTGPVHTA